jgi:hypothetical protein
MRKRAAAGECAYDDITPLVDGDAVHKAVFKTAAAPDVVALSKVAVAIEPETFDFNTPAQRPMQKVAAAVEKPTAQQSSRHADVLVGRVKIAAEEKADLSAMHRIHAERKIDALVNKFGLTSAPPFDAVEKVAMSLYPEEGLKLVFDLVYKAGNLDRIGHRRHTGDLAKYASTADYADFIADVKAIRDDIGHSLLAKIAADDLYVAAQRGEIALLKLANPDKGSDDGVGFNPLSAVSPVLGATASLGDALVGGAKDLSATTEEAIGQFAPKHQRGSINERLKSEVNNDHIRMSMRKIMDADPVVSKYPRDKVVSAYNEIVTLQPSLATQPLALRSALRRYLVSGGDFTMQEAMQLRNFEKAPQQLLDPSVMQEKA